MVKNLAYRIAALIALLLFLAAPAAAQLKVGAAKWRASGVFPLVNNFSTCEEALATGIELARAFENDPLVLVGSDCPAVRPTGT
jgi:hypothetical protein